MPIKASERILCVGIGGSRVKAILLNRDGSPASAYRIVITPAPPSPENMVATVQELANLLDDFAFISVGFPGYVRKGIIRTAPNLGTDRWAGVDLQQLLSRHFGKPVCVVNDADLLGLGIARGRGLELVVTLGTGFGTALLLDGKLLPHLEIAHHPVHDSLDYDQYVGEAARKSLDLATWNDRMLYLIDILRRVTNYDTLHLAGGNARLLNIPLPENVRLSDNEEGIKGGARLWSYQGQLVFCPEATPRLAGYHRMMDIRAMA